MKKIVITSAFVITCLVLFYYFLSVGNSGTSLPTHDKSLAAKKKLVDENVDSNNVLSSSEGFEESKSYPNYFECSAISRKQETVSQGVRSNFFKHLPSELLNSYTLDELSHSLLKHHIGSVKAWHLEQIRTTHPVTTLNQKLNEPLSSVNKEAGDFKVVRFLDFPQKDLKFWDSKTTEQKREVLDRVTVTVDDIAAILNKKGASEESIIELLNHVKQPNSLIGSAHENETPYLLSNAIATRHFRVANWLLENVSDWKPEHFMNNALDITLAYTDKQLNSKMESQEAKLDLKQLTSLVSRLSELGYRTKIREGKGRFSGQLVGGNGRYYFSVNKDNYARLLDEFNVDLKTLSYPEGHVSYLDNTELDQAVKLLIQNKTDSALASVGEPDSNKTDIYSYCSQLVQRVEKKWKPFFFGGRVFSDKARREFSSDDFLFRQVLAERDPDFVVCYGLYGKRRHKSISESRVEHIRGLLVEFVGKGSFNSFENLNLSSAEIDYLFYDVVKEHLSVDEAVAAGLLPESVYYDMIDWKQVEVKQILKWSNYGLDFKAHDGDGMTAVYYAAKAHRLDLIEFFNNNNYPVNSKDGAPDALHYLLSMWKIDFDKVKLLELLDKIMSNPPRIDKFHFARMKQIQLLDAKLYKLIVNRFSELIVDEKEDYPKPACK